MARLTEYEESLILKHYEYGDFDWLSRELGKSKHAISELARKRGLKRRVCVTRNGSLAPLLDGSLEANYWLGMYLADGYISKNGHFMLSQTEKDKIQIDRLSKFLGTDIYFLDKDKSKGFKNKQNAYRVNVSDKCNGIRIREMFGVYFQKTYDDLEIKVSLTTEQATSLLIGFIDGDGSVYSSGYVSAMFSTSSKACICQLLDMSLLDDKNAKLTDYYKKERNKYFTTLRINKDGVLKLLSFIRENQLLVNDRKWGKIDNL